MAEYIDRETLRKILKDWRDAHADVDDEQGCGLLEDVICEVDAQTVVDAAEVVRCKDCESGQVSDDGKYIICCNLGVRTGFYDFCSYGEQKSGGADNGM